MLRNILKYKTHLYYVNAFLFEKSEHAKKILYDYLHAIMILFEGKETLSHFSVLIIECRDFHLSIGCTLERIAGASTIISDNKELVNALQL